jgi:hypothetical protein
MFSFNIWSEKPTPTNANTTHWFSLLNKKDQQEIINKLETQPFAMIVLQRLHLHYLYKSNLAPEGPLKDYIYHHFQPTLRLDNYDIWTHRGREIAFVNIFQIRGQIIEVSTINRPEINGSISVFDKRNDKEFPLVLENSDLGSTPNGLNGTPIFHLKIKLPPDFDATQPKQLILLFKNATGHLLTSAKFNEAPSPLNAAVPPPTN